jgi:hypothetical protein
MLLATTQLRPYAHPTLNLVAQSAQLNLLLLLLVGVLLKKLNVHREGDGHFFSGIVSAVQSRLAACALYHYNPSRPGGDRCL